MQIIPHMLYKVQKDRSGSLQNQLWQISYFQLIWNDFYHGLTLRLLVNSAKYIAR